MTLLKKLGYDILYFIKTISKIKKYFEYLKTLNYDFFFY